MDASQPTSTPTASGESSSGRGRWLLPAALFALAAGVRVVYVLALRDHPRFDAPVMDAGYHHAWASALARGQEFADGPFFRAPLYPLFLAGVLALFDGGTLAPRLLQALLGGLTSVLTYRLGARVFGEAAGRVAGALAAASWVLIAFDAELLIPALLVPLLLLALERAVAWGGEDRPRSALFVGALFGLAAIARPNVLLFMPWLFGWAIVRTRGARCAALLTVGTLLPILPVTLHNVLEGDPSLIATQGGVNFWIGNNPSSDGVTAIVPGTREGWFEGYRDAIAIAEAAEGRELAPTEVSAHFRNRALRWMSDSPGPALALLGWKARLLFTNVELANNQDMDFTAFRTMPALRWTPSRWDVLFGFGSVGLVLGLVRRRRGGGVLAAFVVIYAVSIVLFFVTSRFRVPLIPPLAIASGFAIVEIVREAKGRRWLGAAKLLAPALLLALASNAVPAGIDTSDANGLADLGRAELGRGDAARALEYLDRAIVANPRSVQVRMALASAIVAAGADPIRAVRILQEAQQLPLGRDNPELTARLLDARIDAGEASAVLGAVRRELVKRPRDGALRFVLARAQASTGNPRAGLLEWSALLDDEPENVGAALALAQVTDSVGTRAEAALAYERLLAMGDLLAPTVAARAAARLRELRVEDQ